MLLYCREGEKEREREGHEESILQMWWWVIYIGVSMHSSASNFGIGSARRGCRACLREASLCSSWILTSLGVDSGRRRYRKTLKVERVRAPLSGEPRNSETLLLSCDPERIFEDFSYLIVRSKLAEYNAVAGQCWLGSNLGPDCHTIASMRTLLTQQFTFILSR